MFQKSTLMIVILTALGTSAYAQNNFDTLPPIQPDTIRVFLVRHAETYHNVTSGMSPSDAQYFEITEKGIQQSKAVGELLKDQPIVAGYSSETDRTRKTLEYTGLPKAKNFRPSSDPGFNRPVDGTMADGTKTSFAWRIEQWNQSHDPSPNDGESLSEACHRFFQRVIEEEKAYGKAIVVVSHGDILAGVVGSATLLQPWDRWNLLQDDIITGSISVIDVEKDDPPYAHIVGFTPKVESE